ncbi:hypothetical protein EVAR_17906_1 [Eumeta japonica]|uniref:FLYWCH-type domain-containing protein n=1 Tax=Eumeta variegata TaxID=151549 RepID=A0A4C1UZI0_EUMVA|nr:hypothetical protein EVAR_17906_1 [Eumeta japonica]
MVFDPFRCINILENGPARPVRHHLLTEYKREEVSHIERNTTAFVVALRPGKPLIIFEGFRFCKKQRSKTSTDIKTRWVCSTHNKLHAEYIISARGNKQLKINNYRYRVDRKTHHSKGKTRWRCLSHDRFSCKAHVYTVEDEIVFMNDMHTFR